MEEQNCLKLWNEFESEFLPENQNLKWIEEYIIVEEDELDNFIKMFEMETKIEEYNKTKFSVLINKKYLIVFTSFKMKLKELIHKYVLKIRNLICKQIKDSEKLISLSLFCNLILIFSPEFYTLYNMKKQIYNFIINSTEYKIEQILFSEFLFINLINEKNRKCSVSWDYRLFLIKYLNNFDNKLLNLKYIHNLKNFSAIFKCFDKELCSMRDINKLDLEFLYRINEKEKRNYHLWKYLIHLFNFYANDISEIKKYIFYFSLLSMINYPVDHSSFSNCIFYLHKMHKELNEQFILKLKNYLQEIKQIYLKSKENKYLTEIITILEIKNI